MNAVMQKINEFMNYGIGNLKVQTIFEAFIIFLLQLSRLKIL